MKDLYLKRADENMPRIFESVIQAPTAPVELSAGKSIIIDLGNHYVGYFSFVMNYVDVYIDAPVRLCVKFCETQKEIDDDFSTYKGGLSASWLQEEVINIDNPGEYKMPRRYAARYIKISVAASPQKLLLSDIKFLSVTSADIKSVTEITSSDEIVSRIDAVSVNTLKNCMQRVFEDGPKRDRRLWIGDLRLEAISNYYTFNNLELVRRCLYLFSAGTKNQMGFIPAYIYENPEYVSGTWYLEDYALLFVASACDYYNHTNDDKTFYEIYPVIKAQMDAAYSTLDNDGIMTIACGGDAFIDWCEGLNKITALHGVYLYVLKLLINTLNSLNDDDCNIYKERYEAAKIAALTYLYNNDAGAFINDKDSCQFSVHSAVWMILGGVIEGNEAIEILHNALNSPQSVKPFTPYMHHYVVESMSVLGMHDEALTYIKNYWGGMILQGADTFYEVYVPDNPDFSPYGDRMINSMCHAWSCTPSYFIRKHYKNN